MIDALRSGDLAAVRAAIKADPQSAKSPRAVLTAAGHAWKDALALLKRHGADLNAIYRGYRPLHALIQEEPHAHGGKPTPARIACLKWLLDNGADPELDAAWPPSRALLIAAFTGIPEYVKILRDAGAKVDDFARAALGDLKKATPELARATTGKGRMTALHCCCASRMRGKESINVARMLLDAGADPNARAKGWSQELDAAYFAAGSNQADLFDLLLERGANADAALIHALWQKKGALKEIALRHGADVNRARDADKPPLNQMIRWGRFSEARWLLARGADPNQPDGRGWTAVHQAASRGDARMLQEVLDAGGDRARKTNDGHAALDLVQKGRVKKAVLDVLTSALPSIRESSTASP